MRNKELEKLRNDLALLHRDFDSLVTSVTLLCAAVEVINEINVQSNQKIASLEEEIRVLRANIGA